MKYRPVVVLVVAASLFGQLNAVPTMAAERSVRDIQKALAEQGFKPGLPDGVWGKKSIAALRAYQSVNGLPVTGSADKSTIDRLFPPPPPLATQQPVNAVDSKGEIPGQRGLAVETKPLDPIVSNPPSPSEQNDQSNAPASANEPGQAQSVDSITGKTSRTEITQNSPSETATSQPSAAPPSETNSRWTFALLGIAIGGVMMFRSRRKRKREAVKMDNDIKAFRSQHGQEPIGKPSAPQPTPGRLMDLSGTSPSTTTGQLTSLEVHNRNVVDWVNSNASKAKTSSVDSNDDLTEIIEQAPKAATTGGTISPQFGTLLNFHRRPSSEAKAAPFTTRIDASANRMAGAEWMAPGKSVSVSSVHIAGGLFYLGGFLGKQGRLNENENCLVNPALTVGRGRDTAGISMGYWPSYGGMSPDARRSYLEWLAGTRSNPDDYIGYVFLYFYGLERRLLLDQYTNDAAAVLTEVRRLHGIYGHNGSFNRYATELLTAAELKSGEPSAQFLARIEPNGYEVPTAVKIALGIRVRDDRPIEADLMLRFAQTHPETSVRTPAKRAPALLRELYHLEFAKLYPDGYRPRGGRTKKLKKSYQACSGSFNIDIAVLGGDIPDITDREEPIKVARRVFNDCMEQLDDYSRTLGRLPGLEPNLLAIAKLPEALRSTAAQNLPGDPLTRIRRIADQTVETKISDIATEFGLDMGINPGKAKLRDLSQALSSFGIGATFDPAFSVKPPAGEDRAILFPISSPLPGEATEAYRIQQLSVMLGMLVGHADGEFHELERQALLDRVAGATDLSVDEKRRLEAEIKLNEGDASRLDDWLKRLKDVPEGARHVIASELVLLASADGELHADEVRKLETIFKRMGMDAKSLYERLHAGTSNARVPGDNLLPTADATTRAASPSPTRIDLSRLQSIRSETRVTSSVLADIFVEEDEVAVGLPEPHQEVPQSELFEGLEQRYGAFLAEILQRSTWSKDDFEHLARDASLMAGAAKEAINDWSLDRFDELMIEGDDELDINRHLLPDVPTNSAHIKEGIPA
ncbi:TerB N-terminal domain-containing protein [Rhizobium sp. 2MFCol3.1]|uniref:TerB N-terminal domain-containing protein n=1 Tax=Rhizobium sp. 2MFCol3.1 TaxID=1246459 RepID=UPI00039E6C4D|nr:TerB N-terminal domain-containing protein [Rhizobium sp. 2MFCol3.1]